MRSHVHAATVLHRLRYEKVHEDEFDVILRIVGKASDAYQKYRVEWNTPIIIGGHNRSACR